MNHFYIIIKFISTKFLKYIISDAFELPVLKLITYKSHKKANPQKNLILIQILCPPVTTNAQKFEIFP